MNYSSNNYNTTNEQMTSTSNQFSQSAQPAKTIPSGKGGQTPWNSTRSARDWLDSPSPAEAVESAAKKEQPLRPPQMPKLPKLPKLPSIASIASIASLPKPANPTAKEQPAETPPPPVRPKRADRQVQFNPDEPPASTASIRTNQAAKPKKAAKPAANTKARKAKQPKVIAATISGLLVAAIVLLAECGLWGFYCYSHNIPGDTNVNASTFMYCLAVFAGNFWAGAMVRRRTLKPSLIICGVFLLASLVISLNLFSWREIKIKMFLLKILLTLAAATLGFILSLAPYLVNKALKRRRQEQQQLRQRQLERRQMQQQQYELERELAKRRRY